MMEVQSIYVWVLLASILAISTGVIVYLGNKILSQNRKIEEFNKTRSLSLEEDLELATSDQLLAELRKRSGIPYLLVLPISKDDTQGISIEVHNIPPIPCLHLLRLATELTFNELKTRGLNVNELNNPDDFENSEGEDWK